MEIKQSKVEKMLIKEETVMVKKVTITIIKPGSENRYECYSDYHTLDGEYIGSKR